MDLLESVNSPLSTTCSRWTSLIKDAEKIKHTLFGQYAAEAEKFYNSNHNFMWDRDYASKQGGYLSENSFGASGMPTFRVTINPMSDAVRLFGPSLYHRNPNIVVHPKTPPHLDSIDLGYDETDPMQQQMAQAAMQGQDIAKRREETTARLCQHYLNWLQLETDKKRQARRAIDDAIVKGLGVLWTEIYTPPNSSVSYPRSVYMSCDDLVKDPDARYLEEVQWIARRCVHPVNIVEEKYGYKPGSLRGTIQSIGAQQSGKAKRDLKSGKRDSKSFDLIEYWEIYSKNGAGQHLKTQSKTPLDQEFDLSVFGKYCYLAVCDGIPFPLNIPPDIMGDEESMRNAAQWPIPFWEDEGCNNGWPCSELSLYDSTDSIWPIPLIKPVIGEIRFVNWCMSFLADKAAASCKSYMGIPKSEAESIRSQILNNSGPYTLIEISALTGKPLKEVISFIEAPEFNDSIWKMVAAVMERIDKGTGLTELVYGSTGRQLRSAEEARIKNENTTIRPDEMASKTEDFLSDVAMKEMEAAVAVLSIEDFVHVLGETGAMVFANHVFADDEYYEKLVRNFTFRVEAGSARKPNKESKIQKLTEFSNFFLPVAQAFAINGQVGPYNGFINEYCDAADLDPEEFLLQEAPVEQGQDQQAQMEIEQQKLGMEMQSKQADMQMRQEGHQMDMAAKHQGMQLDLMKAQMELQIDAAKASQDMQVKEAVAEQESLLNQQQMTTNAIQVAHKAKLDEQGMKIKEKQAAAAAKNRPVKKPAKKATRKNS